MRYIFLISLYLLSLNVSFSQTLSGYVPPEWFVAAGTGKLEEIKFYHDRYVSVDAKDPMGGTALMRASIRGHLPIVEVLVERGADVNAKDPRGKTALTLASYMGNLEIVNYLKSKGAKE